MKALEVSEQWCVSLVHLLIQNTFIPKHMYQETVNIESLQNHKQVVVMSMSIMYLKVFMCQLLCWKSTTSKYDFELNVSDENRSVQ